MKNMGDYHDHYLKKDVLLLADAFEKFIDTSLKFYKLDYCHYLSSPGLNWDAMLKRTGVKFQTLTCICLLKKGLEEEFLTLLKDTDTDSLTYEIKSKDAYEEFFKHKHFFDFKAIFQKTQSFTIVEMEWSLVK